VRAAAAGKHVVVEKPIEVTLEAADRLIAACDESGVTLSVISQHRWDQGVKDLKELVDSGRLGRLVLGDAIVKWYRTQQYYESGNWRGTLRLDGGGALMNQGVHYVDLLQWVMGPVERVFARARTSMHEGIEVEDIAVAVLSFASGAVGVLESSTAVYPGLGERLEVTGTGGTVIVEAGEIKIRELKDEKGETSPYGGKIETSGYSSARPAAAANPADISYIGHREQLRDVLRAIETGGMPAIDGREARKPLEIILAVYESARSGRDVALPLAVG
jgi:predicted dehydrogenase